MLQTNFVNIKDLCANYTPREHGRIFADEKVLIRETLQMDQMDRLGLQNLMDFVKMYFTVLRDGTPDIEKKLQLRNKENSIVFVIELAILRCKVA